MIKGNKLKSKRARFPESIIYTATSTVSRSSKGCAPRPVLFGMRREDKREGPNALSYRSWSPEIEVSDWIGEADSFVCVGEILIIFAIKFKKSRLVSTHLTVKVKRKF